MNTDFAKLFNNCLHRIDGQDEVIDRNDNGSTVTSENDNFFCNDSYPVRSEIKDIIEEKIKRKASDAESPVLEKLGPINIGKSVELEEAPEKAKILFSLKDFFERSKESQNIADKFSPVEDENKEDPSDLDKIFESLDNDQKDQSQEDDDSDIISDSDTAKSVEDSKSDKESDIEDIKGDEPDQRTDLESEINLFEKLKQTLDDY